MKDFLPESLFGYDSDDMLAYSTPKISLIRDRYIGCLYYCMVFLAMSWVLVGQVLWRNEHFMLKDVQGIPRMLISHPTINQCDPNEADCEANFKSLAELPYCEEHEGGAQVKHPAHCEFADKHTMFVDGTIGGTVFIPTSVIVMEEKQACHPNAKNKHTCKNQYRQTGDDEGYYFNETKMAYYANIEDYTVQFTHTYQRSSISGTSLDHPGFYSQCFDKRKHEGKTVKWEERIKQDKHCKDERRLPVECMPGMPCVKGGLETLRPMTDMDSELKIKIPVEGLDIAGLQLGSSARRFRGQHKKAPASEEDNEDDDDGGETPLRPTPDVFASTWGDTFKLGKLLELADVDLDRHYNMDDLTARMAGTIIEVQADYSNLRRFMSSFGLSQVRYTYNVKERNLPYVSKESLHPDQPEDYPKHRRYLVQHGILLNLHVGGEFGFFSIVYLLIMLTTSLALVATAHKVTDIWALYVHPRQKNYFHCKYDISGDFSDMWRCETCNYHNLHNHKTCLGLNKWESTHDQHIHYCGMPVPEDYQGPTPRDRDGNIIESS